MSKNSLVPSTRLPSLLGNREDFFWPLESAFHQFFNDFWSNGNLDTVKARAGFPKMDIYANKDEWVIEAALPGYDTDDVAVEIVEKNGERVLKVKGDHQVTKRSSDNVYHVQELRTSKFERQVVLPDYVQGDPVANMRDGVLKLTWKIVTVKTQEETKKIPITKIDT